MSHNQMATSVITREVEKRAILKPADYKMVLENLKERKITPGNQIQIHDVYFCPIKVSSFAEIEMDALGSYSLRLRETIKDKESDVEMNVKVITNHGDHSAWDEHEVKIDSLENGRRILMAIGFKPYFEVKKKRVSYKIREFTVELEDIAGFGATIEVEMLTTSDKSEKAKEQIVALMQQLGISKDMLVEKSITNILMKKLAKF